MLDPALDIELIQTQEVDIERQGTPTWANGFCTPGETTILEKVLASVQPTTGEDLLKLPDNAKEKESWRFFSQAESFLKTDVITYEGKKYEILHLERWEGYDLECDHSYGIGVLVDVKIVNAAIEVEA